MKTGLITDIHEDIVSLRKCLSIFEKKGCNELICLGDIVGFSAPHYSYFNSRNARRCIETVRAECNIVIVGNHDLFAAGKLPQHTAGLDFPSDFYSMDYPTKKQYFGEKIWFDEENTMNALIGENEKKYLQSIKEYETAEYENQRVLFSHFLYPNVNGMLRLTVNEMDSREHFAFMKEKKCRLSFCGHAHIEGVTAIGQYHRKHTGFDRTISTNSEFKCYLLPAVAEGILENGCAVWDSTENTLQCIGLKLQKSWWQKLICK